MGKCTIQPLGDRIVVEPVDRDRERRTKGGILLPDNTKVKGLHSRVVAVGPGRCTDAVPGSGDRAGPGVPVEIGVGDVIVHTPFAGVEVEIGGDYYTVLHEEDVTGRVVAA